MLSASDQDFLKAFYQSLADRPLEPDDAVYEPLQRDAGIDPVERLRKGIEWTAGTSAQLLTGYRGSGKSTELRRLRHLLRKNGHVVLLTDVQRHMNLSSPMDVSDFLVILAAAFEAAAADAGLLDAEREPFWSRFVAFLKRIKIDLHFDIEGAGASGQCR